MPPAPRPAVKQPTTPHLPTGLDLNNYDVVIGNPPYIEYAKIRREYSILHLLTEDAGNTYAFVIERSLSLTRSDGMLSMIIPIALTSGDRTATIRSLLASHAKLVAVSSFGFRPSHLFDGVNHRLSVLVLRVGSGTAVNTWSSTYNLWSQAERPVLFQRISFATTSIMNSAMPKFGCSIERSITARLSSCTDRVGNKIKRTGEKNLRLFYNDAVLYWARFSDFQPAFRNITTGQDNITSSTLKTIVASNAIDKDILLCVLNSSLFFWFWITYSDCRHLTSANIAIFPLPSAISLVSTGATMHSLGQKLMQDYARNSVIHRRYQAQTGLIEYQRFFPGSSKFTIDDIDRTLAKYYGLTDEEEDFIINYDIKYRMGQDTDADNEQIE